jgi:hypothetical protein
MIINRHNYEECFILYWDNELTASQKQVIENFVKENTDLQEEFKLLGKTRFTPDNNVKFEEKEFLLNNSFINITNYEEQLLDYVDDELNDNERKEVEKFAATSSTIKKELALFQKTKLQPEEAIVFPDKSILYRKEEKVRVISMTWFKVAVAAAIILIAGFATIRIINNNKSGDKVEIAKNIPVVNPGSANKNSTENPTGKQQGVADPEKNLASTPSAQEKDDQKNPRKDKLTDAVIAFNKNSETNNLPKEGTRTTQEITDLNTKTDEVYADNPITLPSQDKSMVQTSTFEKTNDPFDKSFVTNTSRITSDNIDVPYEVEPSKEKGGLKQFLRKTTRVFESRTNIKTTTDDNKLLLGAFAVSLK